MMNKRDYQKAGFEHARDMMGTVHAGKDPVKEPMFPRHKDSWQAKAYWEGYDSYTTDKARAARYDKIIDGGTPSGQMIIHAATTGRSVNAYEQNSHLLNTALAQQQTILPGRQAGKVTLHQSRFMFDLVNGTRTLPSSWPAGAQSHGYDMARQYMEEAKTEVFKNWRRMARLVRAVQRLYDRHTPATSAKVQILGVDETTNLNQD